MTALNLILALLLSSPLVAQFPGTWKLAAQPNLPEVIKQATAPMNFLIRPIARARLKKTNAAYAQIQIAISPTEITLQYDAREPQHMPADGKPVPWTREDGERFLISARMEQEKLIQTYQAEDGERSNVFHLDPASGRLSLEVTIRSRKLPSPMTYALTYQKP